MNRYNKYRLLHPWITFKRIWYKVYNPAMFRFQGVLLKEESNIANKTYLRLEEGATAYIGKHFTIASGDNINPLSSNRYTSICVDRHAILEIGNYCGISSSTIWATQHIRIGNYVNIGANCHIIDGDMHSIDWKSRAQESLGNAGSYNKCPITIEDHVWIGANSMILKGVTIGSKTIIAMGSVVTKDIPANCIAGGNPCKVIKYITEK